MKIRFIAGAAVAASLAFPAFAGAHATVSALQPQGKSLTSARQLYVLRAPNERADLQSWKIVLYVPKGIQRSIRLTRKPGWTVRATTVDSGQKDAEGAPIKDVVKVVWTARRGQATPPLFYDDFHFRIQNPATPQRMCFWVHQFYGNAERGRTPWSTVETVKWTGPGNSDTPASCVNFVES
jgi:uncharacterized protein YcnI